MMFVWLLLTISCTNQTTPIENVTIGISKSVTSSLDVIAENKGFFAKEGLNVTIKEFPSGKIAMEYLFDNKIDIASSAGYPVVTNSFKRNDFQVVATVGSSVNDNEIIVRKDTGVITVGDLKGKRIGVMQGSMTQYVLDLLLMKNGLNKNDVTIIYDDKPNNLITRLVSADLDALCVLGDNIDKACNALNGECIRFTEENLVRITTCVSALRTKTRQNPILFQKLIRAYIRAEEYVRANPDESLAIVAKRFNRDKAEMVKHWKPHMFHVTLAQSLLIDLESLAKWQMDNRLITATTAPNYMNFIYFDALEKIDPSRVTIVH